MCFSAYGFFTRVRQHSLYAEFTLISLHQQICSFLCWTISVDLGMQWFHHTLLFLFWCSIHLKQPFLRIYTTLFLFLPELPSILEPKCICFFLILVLLLLLLRVWAQWPFWFGPWRSSLWAGWADFGMKQSGGIVGNSLFPWEYRCGTGLCQNRMSSGFAGWLE